MHHADAKQAPARSPRACVLLRTDYPGVELIAVDDGDAPSGISELPCAPIRVIRLEGRRSIGEKRNLACDAARGHIIVHWDDDDWYAPWRIRYQVEDLLRADADVCGVDRLLYYDERGQRAWEYAYPRKARPWVAGNTLCYRKSLWKNHPFPEIDVGEDSRFVRRIDPSRIHRHARSDFVVGLIHESNVSAKRTSSGRWHSRPLEDVRRLMGPDLELCRELAPATPVPTALVAMGRGVGDILRVTPLIRAIHESGRAVDVLLAPDYPGTAALLDGAPEIRQIYVGRPPPTESTYDDAVFAWWGRVFQGAVRADRAHTIERAEWMAAGENAWLARVAATLGCSAPSRPFARHSGRTFNLPPGTIALHPGCKPDWPWKKWHGFDELADMLDPVAIVGLPEDLDNSRTWFDRPFNWPAHARNYIGQLSLADTAALLSQCAALVSNDSGLMHLGAALGIPTLGIFGITSPEREAMRTPHMVTISKGLPCEPACRRERWGRRDCEHHLRCLKTLTPAEVRDKLMHMLHDDDPVPHQLPAVPKARLERPQPRRGPGLVYYGHVFDASGYGAAARAYIHALHAAHVDLQVVNLSGGAPAVRDGLVESLVSREVVPDLRLFHGIPAVWAAEAFRHKHYIAMTVWETSMMPTQWRNVLRRALDVWLPCDFNLRVFEQGLGRSLMKLPHPVPPSAWETGDVSCLQLAPDDVVFYSVFEWQDRKGPFEQMTAFLRAFTGADRAVLVLKTGSSSRNEADAALIRARAATRSDARVMVRAEAWSAESVAALHTRGDCYVSLHRGEGWGYPLFEAAVRGTPVVATAFGGPLEYLDRAHHRLVSYRTAPVRQRYAYYNGAMDWADPDVDDAARSLRWVYENLEEARRLALDAALSLRERYSLSAVGTMGRRRLMDLLQTIDPARWQEITSEMGDASMLNNASQAASLLPRSPSRGHGSTPTISNMGARVHGCAATHGGSSKACFATRRRFCSPPFPTPGCISMRVALRAF